MLIANEYLWDAAPSAARNHFLPKFRILIHIDLGGCEALPLQQREGALAVRTPARHVQGNDRLTHFALPVPPEAVFVKGRLSLVQAFKPPSKLNTLVKPSFASVRAAPAPPVPLSS